VQLNACFYEVVQGINGRQSCFKRCGTRRRSRLIGVLIGPSPEVFGGVDLAVADVVVMLLNNLGRKTAVLKPPYLGLDISEVGVVPSQEALPA